MSPLSPESETLTAQYRAAQQVLGRQVQAAVAHAWQAVDLKKIDKSWPAVARVVAQVIRAGHAGSAGQAVAYLTRHGELNGVAVTPAVADALNAERLSAALTATGPAALKRATQATGLVPRAGQLAQVQLLGASQRLTLAGGRDTVTRTVRSSSKIVGFQRVGGGECAFCALLISRGPVYGSDDFEAHDHDQCIGEPVYDEQPLSGQAQEYKDIYDEATKGLSGQDAINAFRAKVEGREISASVAKAREAAVVDVDATKTVDQLRATLAALEKSAEKFSTPGTRARIADLRRKIAAR